MGVRFRVRVNVSGFEEGWRCESLGLLFRVEWHTSQFVDEFYVSESLWVSGDEPASPG